MRSILFYDFEVFKYDWLICAYDLFDKKWHIIINDSKKLQELYDDYCEDIWIGYNSRNYDEYILACILAGLNPYELSDFIVNKKRKGYEFSDLLSEFRVIGYDAIYMMNGLKKLEAMQGHSIVETSVPFDINRKLTKEEIDETVYYCKNDVLETINVFYLTKSEFDSKLSLVKVFDLPLSYIGKTQAQLSSIILGARKRKHNDEWEIRTPYNLWLKDYARVARWFISEDSHDASAKYEINVYGVPHVFAWGGVHGAIKQYFHTCKEDEVLVMADVDQLYPTIMIEYNLLSRNVKDTDKFKQILDTSLRLKREKKKKEREPYKRICNITYGAEGDKYNAMYDPLHRNLVCCYGQLFLLDLIEKLKGFKLIQSNTDGILYLIKRKDLEKFKSICHQWSERTHLNLSFDEYVYVAQKDVNNYILVDSDGNLKCKGAYVKDLSPLDNDLPIVNKAIRLYLTQNVPVEDTVNSATRLIDFQKIVKLSGLYEAVYHNGIRYTDKVYRVFASTSFADGMIFKYRDGSYSKFGNTPDHSFLDGTDITEKGVPPYLDRQYYIDVAKNRLEQFGARVE